MANLPPWLTKEMLGKSTLSDTTNAFFNNGAKLCARYDEAGRTCRRDMSTFLDKNAPQQQLRSGTQASDFMNDLNNKMWRESSEGKRRAAEALASLVAQTPEGQGAAAGSDGPTGAQGAAAAGDGAGGEPPSGVGASSPGSEGEAPPTWMHVNLLTFALFGPLSDQNDEDLSLSSSDGPTRKTPSTAGSPETVPSTGGSDSPAPGLASSECIKLLVPPNIRLGRRGIKNAQQPTLKIEDDDRGSKRKMADAHREDMALTMREWRESLRNKQESLTRKVRRQAHSDRVRSIRDGNAQKVKAHDRKVKRLKARLKLAADNKDEAERGQVYMELKEALKTDVELEEVPGPFVEQMETAIAPNAAAPTGTTPRPTLMTAGPPPIGAVCASNARVADTSGKAAATTPEEGVARSAVRGQLPPGWAPTPAVACRAPVITPTTPEERVAGSANPGWSSPSRAGGQLSPGFAPTPAVACRAPASSSTTPEEGVAMSEVPAQHLPFSGGSQHTLRWAPPPALFAPGSATVDTRSPAPTNSHASNTGRGHSECDDVVQTAGPTLPGFAGFSAVI